MSLSQVSSILGAPDEIRPTYEPKIKTGKLIGYSHWYVIRRVVRNGSVNDKQEAVVRVLYGLDDRVVKVDAWGL